MFCNTYHLLLSAGPDTISKAGGLHKFINFGGLIMTDSGGFQVFSLADRQQVSNELKGGTAKKYSGTVLKLSEEGVTFRSYRDGAKVLLTPETTVQTQRQFLSDIVIPLDELCANDVSEETLMNSFERTHRWEKRSLDEFKKLSSHDLERKQFIYSVIHGGTNLELRKRSLEILDRLGFDGHAIGGSLGANLNQMNEMLTSLMPQMPPEKPRHLLGMGDMEAIEIGIRLGIDTFDSAYPTRAGRHGSLMTSKGLIKIRKEEYKNDFETKGIDGENCDCFTCKNYSLGYLHHLFRTEEPTAGVLGSIHNLRWWSLAFERIRTRILNNEI